MRNRATFLRNSWERFKTIGVRIPLDSAILFFSLHKRLKVISAFNLLFIAATPAQIESDAYSPSFFNAYIASSTLINGIFLILFVGVVLSTLKQILRKPEAEEEEQAEEKRKVKKLTYQV